MNRRDFLLGASGAVGLVGLGGFNYPGEFQRGKRRVGVYLEDVSDLPNLADDELVESIGQKPIKNLRTSLEDKVASLFISRPENIGQYLPGGVLLGKEDTRNWNLLGKYSTYSPQKTQNSVQRVLDLADQKSQRVLICDEGEGGYVMGIGTLPAATHIGNYLYLGEIGNTIKGRVSNSGSFSTRQSEVVRLFDEYAKELSDRGVDCVFGPVLDVVDPRFKDDNLIAQNLRDFASICRNPHTKTREIAEMYISAMHNHGIKCVGKHFLSAGLSNEDPHVTEVENSDNINRRIWASQIYRALRNDLDGVMVTHTGNPSDLGRPYTLSKRGLELLTNASYPSGNVYSNSPFSDRRDHGSRRFDGVGFGGYVIADEVKMRGLLDYVKSEPLSDRGSNLVRYARSPESKAVILAIDQGVNSFITLNGCDEIVQDVCNTYEKGRDEHFRTTLESSRAKYAEFIS